MIIDYENKYEILFKNIIISMIFRINIFILKLLIPLDVRLTVYF